MMTDKALSAPSVLVADWGCSFLNARTRVLLHPRLRGSSDEGHASPFGKACEVCGAPGGLRGGPLVTTRGEAHAEGRRPVAVRRGGEIQSVERIVGGRRCVRRRRYDRESDSFVDVDTNVRNLTLSSVEMRLECFPTWE